jgi:hypothetical protein
MNKGMKNLEKNQEDNIMKKDKEVEEVVEGIRKG